MDRLFTLILFVAIEYASAQDCGGELKGPNGTVTSPNWPRNYPDNARCTWTITVGEVKAIELEFLDFELERGSPINGCLGHDFVRVVDGGNTYGPFCGDVAPPKIISKTNKLKVTFSSDESRNYRGFQASYKEIPTTSAPTCVEAGGACAETCPQGELKGTCKGSSLKCCKSTPAPNSCGKRFNSGGDLPYIVGGDEAQPNSWPWQLSLQTDTGLNFCGAVLLSDEWAITAAACVYDVSTVTVVAGEHDLLIVSGDEVRIVTSKIIVHEDYINAHPKPNDIALLKLSKKLPLGPKIFPACFPQKEDMEFGPDDNCYVTGWGCVKGTGGRTVLKEVAASPVSNDVCSLSFDDIIDTKICARNSDGGPCSGDNGGPLICKKDDKWFLAGVFSYETFNVNTLPSVYTRMAKFKSWVDKTIKANGGY